MRKLRKILAVLLTLTLLVLSVAMPASAASKVDPSQGAMQKLEAVFYMLLDKLVMVVGKVLNRVIPGLDWGNTWQNYDDYEAPDTFYKGEESFDTEVEPGAVWSAGYAYGSLLEGLDVLNGEYNMAGSLQALSGKKPTGILDDQGVNVYALSDGVSGTVIQAVVDGYGLARGDVLKIREKLFAFAAENNIISINISTLHQHSLIDTLGMGVALVPALVLNPGMNALGMDKQKLTSGKTQSFMDNLYEVVTSTVIEAVEDMQEGSLYYGSADVSDLIHDKRKPEVIDGEISRFRFDPKDEAADEIWVCEAGIHCTGFGSDDYEISADFPYYFKEYVKEATGADVVYVQGAELAIGARHENTQSIGDGKEADVKGYGVELAKRAMTISNEVALEPVLNIAVTEVAFTADNPVHILAVREGITETVVAKNGLDLVVVTEVGYMELGNKVGVAMIPGEIAPEILWGGAVSKEESWTKTSWDYAALEKTAGVERLICFGLNNDQIGYILTDNDIRSMFTENEEINAASVKVGSVITEAFEKLVAAVK